MTTLLRASLSSSLTTATVRQLSRQTRVLDSSMRALASYSSVSTSIIERTGDHPYGSRQYRLMDKSDQIALASIRAHRNIIFGAQLHQMEGSLVELCRPLFIEALQDAGSNAEQPQGLATLHGLSAWIQQGLNSYNSSEHYTKSFKALVESLTDIQLEAVRAIATGVPRPGHSVVGPGTHRDAGDAWELLAREFIQSKTMERDDDECLLYTSNGGQLVGIELLADTQPVYLESAGGAMARFFLL